MLARDEKPCRKTLYIVEISPISSYRKLFHLWYRAFSLHLGRRVGLGYGREAWRIDQGCCVDVLRFHELLAQG